MWPLTDRVGCKARVGDMTATGSLISQLESAVQRGSRERRLETLRRVTDLFLDNASGYDEDQVRLFDDVLLRLTSKIYKHALAEISRRLALVGNAPIRLIGRLARDDDIAVAAPVLACSPRLSNGDLIEIAETKGQEHLSAVSRRKVIPETVTDVLIKRGDRQVVGTLAKNQGASFSESGYSALVERAAGDDELTESVGIRIDVPPAILSLLLSRAKEEVRARLLVQAPAEQRDNILNAFQAVSGEIVGETDVDRSYAESRERILSLERDGRLDEAAIQTFARQRFRDEMIVGIARLCRVPINLIERVLFAPRSGGLLVVCKAAEMTWTTVSAILVNRFADFSMSAAELENAKKEFDRLTTPTAQRVLRFWLARQSVVRSETAERGSIFFKMMSALAIRPSALDGADPVVVTNAVRRCDACDRKAECLGDIARRTVVDHYRGYCRISEIVDRLREVELS
jgi:hypothetical protein